MNKLYDALEICLNEIERGADVDTVIFQYPDLAVELRPILEASVKAKDMAASSPSPEAVKRNRAKLLQHAAQMREQKNAPALRRMWSVPLRRALVTLMIVAMLFASGTSLVRASSTTLPGDNLYPVKRTYEEFQLFFTFDDNQREALELEHENERLDELHELIAQGRTAKVDFSGYVKGLTGTEWQIDGVTVMVSPQAIVPNQPVSVGDAVRVKGLVQSDGIITAEKIELLPPGSIMPEGRDDDNDDDELETDNESGNSSQQIVIDSQNVPEPEPQEPAVIPTLTPLPLLSSPPTSDVEPKNESLFGIVKSIQNNFVVVSGVVVNIGSAKVEGEPRVGVTAEADGFYDAAGVFIARQIKFGSSEDENSVTIGTNDDNKNINTNDDDHVNTNDDDHDNTNNSNEDNENSH